jgi:two-component SAPR family response regulator
LKKLNEIFLIDDDHLENYLNEAIISKTEIAEKVTVFQDPIDALEELNRCFSNDSAPELIFLDLKMPELNGMEFIDRYANIRNGNSGTKLIVLTSSINETYKSKTEEKKDVLEFRLKPLTARMLTEIHEKYFSF